MTYRVDVTHDGRWWMVHVPELDALTQALSRADVSRMAHDLIATVTNVEPEDVSVDIHFAAHSATSRVGEG